MKKMLALMLCLMLLSMPLSGLAKRIPKFTPTPEPIATPVPYEDDQNDDNNNSTPDGGSANPYLDIEAKWVSLRGDYELLVPAGYEEHYDSSQLENGIYYSATNDEGSYGVVFMSLTEIDGMTITKELAGLAMESNGAELVAHHYIDMPMDALFYSLEEGELQGLIVIFDGVDVPGCHLLLFASTDMDHWVEEYVEDSLQNIRKI